MTDFQDILNILLGAVTSVALYLFHSVQGHEKRIQKIEDVHALKIDHIVNKVDAMEEKINEISASIHDKTVESNLAQAITLFTEQIKERAHENRNKPN